VLDFTRHIPGPYCTMLLADLGADVVKVEEPALGDPARLVPPGVGDVGAAFAALNRNKRSLAVDLRTEGGAALLRRLAAGADVVVEGFRPGVLDRRGLGAAALRDANPRLVYCSITGFPPDGDHGLRAGHDVGYAALSGFVGGTRDAAGRPVLAVAQVADMAGALYAACAILAALLRRERTGRGERLEVALSEAALGFMSVPAARASAGAAVPTELQGTHACYNVYRCRDGKWLAAGALEPKFWEGLCAALGLPHLGPRQWAGGEARAEAVRELERAFASRDRAEWLEALRAHDVCVEPVLDPGEALDHSLAAALRMEAGGTPVAGLPMRFAEAGARAAGAVPALGAHTEEVMREAGYGAGDIAALRAGGALG
jgi:crotonobetainyl-CoA:carnitine CoA-transferase CaiB-like acyl-CoA transferase